MISKIPFYLLLAVYHLPVGKSSARNVFQRSEHLSWLRGPLVGRSSGRVFASPCFKAILRGGMAGSQVSRKT